MLGLKEIKQCAQNMLTIRGPMVNMMAGGRRRRRRRRRRGGLV
jgi:hypothetical protein